MSVTVVGSVALDTVETPWGRNEEGLGGAATYFALAAANYTQVQMVGVVGEDFPESHVTLLRDRGIDLTGLEKLPGQTFRWSGRYHKDVNLRDTLHTQLNVFEHFHPKLPESARQAPFLFLGNIHPSLQKEVLEQSRGAFVALDTMDLWINTALDELKDILRRIDAFIVNDSEVRQLTGELNVMKGARAVLGMGPRIVVIKKGEHGCLLFQGDRAFAIPAFLLESVVDPTGAGDSFAGGFLGYLARENASDFETLRRAVIHGSVVASYTCEAFGPDRLAEIRGSDIEERYRLFRALSAF